MTEQERLGQQVLNYLHKTMQIDEEWTVREPLGFTWWGHDLPQRVWIELVPRDFPLVRVQAECALLRRIPTSQKVQGGVDVLNKCASLNTYHWDPNKQSLSLRCSAYITMGTIGWMQQFFAAAMALQVADAHVKAKEEFARILNAEVDRSSHPSKGPRGSMDDMLNCIDQVFAPQGRKDSPFTRADFEALDTMDPTPSIHTSTDADGATAEFAYFGEKPASLLKVFQKGSPPQTALCEILRSPRHPQLGSGVLWKLTLPLDLTDEEGRSTATELNLAEFTAISDPYFYSFGAWCSDPDRRAPAYVMFIPAAIHRPQLLPPFLWSMWARTQWAKQYLAASGQRPGRA